jgi:hypothetical protein
VRASHAPYRLLPLSLDDSIEDACALARSLFGLLSLVPNNSNNSLALFMCRYFVAAHESRLETPRDTFVKSTDRLLSNLDRRFPARTVRLPNVTLSCYSGPSRGFVLRTCEDSLRRTSLPLRPPTFTKTFEVLITATFLLRFLIKFFRRYTIMAVFSPKRYYPERNYRVNS